MAYDNYENTVNNDRPRTNRWSRDTLHGTLNVNILVVTRDVHFIILQWRTTRKPRAARESRSQIHALFMTATLLFVFVTNE